MARPGFDSPSPHRGEAKPGSNFRADVLVHFAKRGGTRRPSPRVGSCAPPGPCGPGPPLLLQFENLPQTFRFEACETPSKRIVSNEWPFEPAALARSPTGAAAVRPMLRILRVCCVAQNLQCLAATLQE